MQLTEKDYNELYKHALKQSQRFIGFSDTAYDIAQNSLLAYLSSKTEVMSPKSWLTTVVKREAMKLVNAEARERDIKIPKSKC